MNSIIRTTISALVMIIITENAQAGTTISPTYIKRSSQSSRHDERLYRKNRKTGSWEEVSSQRVVTVHMNSGGIPNHSGPGGWGYWRSYRIYSDGVRDYVSASGRAWWNRTSIQGGYRTHTTRENNNLRDTFTVNVNGSTMAAVDVLRSPSDQTYPRFAKGLLVAYLYPFKYQGFVRDDSGLTLDSSQAYFTPGSVKTLTYSPPNQTKISGLSFSLSSP